MQHEDHDRRRFPARRHGRDRGSGGHRARRSRDATTVVDLVHARHGADLVDRFDAFVIGSAIYEGRRIRGARSFVQGRAIELQHAPVWLFSSGPLGDDQHVGVDAGLIVALVHAVDAVEHRMFTGELDRHDLGRLERWIVDVVRAPDGDFREWDVIDAWAATIDAELRRRGGAGSDR